MKDRRARNDFWERQEVYGISERPYLAAAEDRHHFLSVELLKSFIGPEDPGSRGLDQMILWEGTGNIGLGHCEMRGTLFSLLYRLFFSS